MSGVIHVSSLKTAREALCLAEGAVRHVHGPTPRAELIAAMIRDIDEQRSTTCHLNHELIAKIADAIDGRLHGFRVNHETWRPGCTCGWSAEESYDVAAYDRHLAELALEAIHNTLNGDDND